MFKTLLIAPLFLFVNMAMAQTSEIDAMDRQINELNAQGDDFNIKLKEARESLAAAQKAQATARANFERVNNSSCVSAGCAVAFSGGNPAATQGQINVARIKMDAANQAIDRAEANVQKYEVNLKNVTNTKGMFSGSKERSEKAFKAVLNGQGLTTEFALLKAQAGSIDSALNRMDAQLDKMVIGAYMKDKVGQLLNSQLICKAQKRCSVSGLKPIANSEVEEALFPNSKESTREGSYHDKVNSSGAAQ